MAETSASYLADIAVAEREELAAIEKVAAGCRERVEELRRQCRQEIAGIPTQLQQERRELIARVRNADELEVAELMEHSRCEIERVEGIVERLSEEIGAVVLNEILPHTVCGMAGKRDS